MTLNLKVISVNVKIYIYYKVKIQIIYNFKSDINKR